MSHSWCHKPALLWLPRMGPYPSYHIIRNLLPIARRNRKNLYWCFFFNLFLNNIMYSSSDATICVGTHNKWMSLWAFMMIKQWSWTTKASSDSWNKYCNKYSHNYNTNIYKISLNNQALTYYDHSILSCVLHGKNAS